MANDQSSAILQGVLSQRFSLAQKGRAFWLAHNLDAYDRVLLLPHGEKQTKLESSLKKNTAYLARLAKSGHKPLACLSDTPPDLADGVEWVQVTREELDALLSLYAMYDFTDKLIIVSFDLPYGRKLRNLLESGITDECTLMDDVILGALHGKDA